MPVQKYDAKIKNAPIRIIVTQDESTVTIETQLQDGGAIGHPLSKEVMDSLEELAKKETPLQWDPSARHMQNMRVYSATNPEVAETAFAAINKALKAKGAVPVNAPAQEDPTSRVNVSELSAAKDFIAALKEGKIPPNFESRIQKIVDQAFQEREDRGRT